LLLNQSSLNLSEIPTNSVDYVFTDPPYGGSVQYFELSTLWCAWLNRNKKSFNLDYNGEITINENQGKYFEFYHNMLKKSFEEIK
jgi:DNA modification methylase